MSAFFDSHKDAYIRHLYEVSSKGDWRSWLEFCLRGVVEQAGDAIRRCEDLLELQRKFREKIQTIRASNRLGAIVDLLFSNPAVQISPLADMCEVSYNTAKSDIEKLQALGILSQTEMNNVKSFYSHEILRITYE
jgi:Fic family protein